MTVRLKGLRGVLSFHAGEALAIVELSFMAGSFAWDLPAINNVDGIWATLASPPHGCPSDKKSPVTYQHAYF